MDYSPICYINYYLMFSHFCQIIDFESEKLLLFLLNLIITILYCNCHYIYLWFALLKVFPNFWFCAYLIINTPTMIPTSICINLMIRCYSNQHTWLNNSICHIKMTSFPIFDFSLFVILLVLLIADMEEILTSDSVITNSTAIQKNIVGMILNML